MAGIEVGARVRHGRGATASAAQRKGGRDVAHHLARREQRSTADVVEHALSACEIREAGHEPAAAFYARLASDRSIDIELEAVIRESQQTNPGLEL